MSKIPIKTTCIGGVTRRPRAVVLGISKKETFYQLNKQTLLLLTDAIVHLQWPEMYEWES